MVVIEARTIVNIHAAKTHPSQLVERAGQGEGTVIVRSCRPVERLVPYRGERGERGGCIPGYWRGPVEMRPAFGKSDERIALLFGMVD